MADSLVAQGLLTRDRVRGKRVQEIQLPCQTHEIVSNSDGQYPVVIHLHHVVAFVRAYLATVVTLHVMSLSWALKRLTAKSARGVSKGVPTNVKDTRELVLVFRRLRLLLYTAKSACLFDSIVMMRFLSAYSIYPTFVIGVAMEPFRAHCWLQEGSIVLNGVPKDTEQCSPILTI
jgi:hypothetical protein